METLKLTKKYTPYPEYKNSGVEWVGKIPKDWTMASSRQLFSTYKERVGSSFGDYKILSLTLHGVIPKIMDGSGKNPAEYDTYQVFKKDDLVFCLFDYDVTPRTIGYVEENGMMTGAYTRLVPKTEAYSKYFYYYFLSLDYTKELLHLCTGLRNSLSKPIFWSMKSSLPSYKDQTKIANYLDEKIAIIDQTIGKKEKLIELLREKHTAVINNAVTKGLDPKVEFVESGIDWIGRIPKGWSVSSLKTLLQMQITDGPHTTPKLLEDGVRFISAESIQANNTIDFNKNRGFISWEDHIEFCKKAKPQMDDIFMVKSGATTGRIAIVETNSEFSIWSPLALIRTEKNKALPKYVYFFLQSGLFQDQVKFSWSFGTQQNIGMRVIENLMIIYPPVQLQKDIVKYLDTKMPNFDIAMQKIENSIELLNEFKSSLISNVVTGKVKV